MMGIPLMEMDVPLSVKKNYFGIVMEGLLPLQIFASTQLKLKDLLNAKSLQKVFLIHVKIQRLPYSI